MKRFADLHRSTKNWMLGHKLWAVILALVLVFTAPWPARAQIISPCCALLVAGLSSIQSALTKVVGGGLNQILGVDQAMQQFQQAVVWPQNLINQARNLVGVLQGNFNQIQNLMHIPINSATLPLSQQLEQVILSRNPNQIAQTSGAYTALYGPVPAAIAASPQVLNMVDMTDAAAQAAMKRAIEIDALADLELQAANQLNQSIQTAAPGSAPIIEAQADTWLIRANAYGIEGYVYSISDRGVSELIGLGEYYTGPTRRPKDGQPSKAVYHAIELNEIHLALKRSQQLIQWMPDTEVRSRNELTEDRYFKDYDAVVTVRNEGKERTFALEYERTPKARKEYLDIRANIEAERAVDQFLYLVPNYDLMSFLVGCFATLRRPIYFGLARDFLDKLFDMPLRGARPCALTTLRAVLR